ncbi:hypothetical protein JCM8547_007191 [Rhodosporidiobolus lusitaniae]
MADAPRPHSPSPSTTSTRTRDLIRSYTTSSQTSADEQIREAREKRERRMREREREVSAVREVDEDVTEEGGPSEVPAVQVEEVQDEGEGATTTGFSSPNDQQTSSGTSFVPKLRIKPTSDRSYTPTIPGTPSTSRLPSSSSTTSSPRAPSVTAPADIPHPAPPSPSVSPAPSTVSHARRSSFKVAEIPPFRPKSASPAPAPTPPPPAIDASATPPPPVRTPSPGVVLSGGLMARLKAQRAAKAEAEAKAAEAEKFKKSEVVEAERDESTVEPASTLPTFESVASSSTTAPAPPAEADPPRPSSPTHSTTSSRPLSPVESVRSASRASSAAPSAVSSRSSRREEVAEFEQVEAAPPPGRPVSPPEGRRTQASKVFGRNGEEFDYDFTELSDVPEQSERSSLSTWRDSLPYPRRQNSTSTSSTHPHSSFLPSSANPNRFSYSSSIAGRQQLDGSFARPASISSLSRVGHTRSLTDVPSASAPQQQRERRVDATEHLLGRSGSSRSIFAGSISSSSASSAGRSSIPPPLPPKSPAASSSRSGVSRTRSPVRQVSPEVARRAAAFGTTDAAPRSPTKFSSSSSPTKSSFSFRHEEVSLSRSPKKKEAATNDAASTSSSLSISVSSPPPPALPTNPPTAVPPPIQDEEPEDPLVAIERRRTQRRKALESFRLDNHEPADLPRDRTWSEIEAVERAQVGDESGSTASMLEKEAERLDRARQMREEQRKEREERMKRLTKRSESFRTESVGRVSERSKGSMGSEPGSPRAGPVCEGYLLVPPIDGPGLTFADYFARPQDWVSRYCVLTNETLEFRPTDHNLQSRPIVVFRLAECSRIEDEPHKPFETSFRPFAILLKDGERLYFAPEGESRRERVRWVLALQDAVIASQRQALDFLAEKEKKTKSLASFFDVDKESIKSLPASVYSESRESMRSWRKGDEKSKTTVDPSYGLYDFADEKKRLRSAPSAASLVSSKKSSFVGDTAQFHALPLAYEKDLFSRWTTQPTPHSPSAQSCTSSSTSDRPLPAVPPKEKTGLPPLPSLPRDAFPPAGAGHRHARSELSSYATPHDQPPFRPTPTRPSPSSSSTQPHPALNPLSPSSLLPARPSTHSATTSSAPLKPTDIVSMQNNLVKAWEQPFSSSSSPEARMRKERREERYRKMQDRLSVVQQKLSDDGRSGMLKGKKGKKGEMSLAEKVDYLLEMNALLLQKQKESAAFHADAARVRRLNLEEEELERRLTTGIDDILGTRQQPQQAPLSPSLREEVESVRTIKAGRASDVATFTTRAGIHSASEKLEWERDLQKYENEANLATSSLANSLSRVPASSLASPNTVRHHRDAASRRLEGRSPLPTVGSIADDISPDQHFRFTAPLHGAGGGKKDPFAGSGVVEPFRGMGSEKGKEKARPTQDGAEKGPLAELYAGAQQTPSLRPYDDWNPARSSSSWQDMPVEQTLLRILEGFDRQNGSLQRNEQRQERVSQVISELAKWVADDRKMRDDQFDNLIGAVNGVVQHVADLPQRLLASLVATEAGEGLPSLPPSPAPVPLPTLDLTDEVEGIANGLVAAAQEDPVGGEEGAEAGDGRMGEGGKKKLFGVNAMSSFAQLDRKIAAEGKEGAAGGAAAGSRLKGPRMPGIRLWGAPQPVADRAARWGGQAVAIKEGKDKTAADEALAEDAERNRPPHGPIVEALKSDEKLGAALQAIAAGEGGEAEAGMVSLAVLEILQTMRDIQKKQADDEKKKAEERAANGGLSVAEKAELEAKTAEIARLEKEMLLTADRTAHINELVAQLADRTDKADAMLAQIAANVKEGKTTVMDPALSEEVKKLLGGVRSGVDDHVKDFRGQLTNEVQRMFKEVGKLRDEKKLLQADIADLLQFQAKYGGVAPKPPAAAPAPKPVNDVPPEPPKPGMPSSGFFGPRPMK